MTLEWNPLGAYSVTIYHRSMHNGLVTKEECVMALVRDRRK